MNSRRGDKLAIDLTPLEFSDETEAMVFVLLKIIYNK